MFKRIYNNHKMNNMSPFIKTKMYNYYCTTDSFLLYDNIDKKFIQLPLKEGGSDVLSILDYITGRNKLEYREVYHNYVDLLEELEDDEFIKDKHLHEKFMYIVHIYDHLFTSFDINKRNWYPKFL